MPLYLFDCEDCGPFEQRVAMDMRNKVRCECGKKAILVFQPNSNIFSNRRFKQPDETITADEVF